MTTSTRGTASFCRPTEVLLALVDPFVLKDPTSEASSSA